MCTPARRGLSCTGGKGCECRCVAPSKVDGAKRGAVAPTELLRERTIAGSVLRANGCEFVGERPDGIDKESKRRGGRWISAGGERGVKLLEEAEGGRGDCKGALLVPDDERIVELLCNRERGEIPWLEDHVRLYKMQGRVDYTHYHLGRRPRGSDRWRRQHWQECQN